MFIREVKNLIDKNLYNRCMDLSRNYFDKTFYKFPELQLWAESTRRYIIQIWRLQDLLEYYKDNVDLSNSKNYSHYKYGLSLLQSPMNDVFDWKFIDYTNVITYKHNIKHKYAKSR